MLFLIYRMVQVHMKLVFVWRQKYVKQSLSEAFKHVPSWPDRHEYADFIPSSNIQVHQNLSWSSQTSQKNPVRPLTKHEGEDSHAGSFQSLESKDHQSRSG